MAMRIYKGIGYYDNYAEARDVNEAEEIGGRLVCYGLGWAIQYRVSGPYWPERDPRMHERWEERTVV